MTWLAILEAVLKLAGTLADYASRRQLLTAGQAEAVSAGLQASLTQIQAAKRGSDAVTSPGSSSDAEYARRLHDRYKRPD